MSMVEELNFTRFNEELFENLRKDLEIITEKSCSGLSTEINRILYEPDNKNSLHYKLFSISYRIQKWVDKLKLISNISQIERKYRKEKAKR